MKAVIGVDLAGYYKAALQTLLGLKFENPDLCLVHAVEPLPAFIPELGPSTVSAASYMTQLHTAGETEVHRAEMLACSEKVHCSCYVTDGSPPAILMDYADSLSADIITVGSSTKDRLSIALFGSVGRALAVGAKQSILVSKAAPRDESAPLTAVFATDHSAYSEQCLQKLLRWAPRGLEKVHVVHAYEINKQDVSRLEPYLPPEFRSAEDWIERRAEDKTKGVAKRFEELGVATQVLVARGHPNEVIRTEMHATNADLLILGAQGHGFIERLLIGSVSLHQVVAEKYSVLVVRT